MDHIILVCGNWKLDRNQWLFMVDGSHGCKIIGVGDDVSYDSFLEMVYDDFGVNQQLNEVKLSYMPYDLMQTLPEDTPPVFVTNDRQLRGFVQQFRRVAIRLCVEISKRSVENTESRLPSRFGRFIQNVKQEFVQQEEVKQEVEEDEDTELRFDYCDDIDGASSTDEDFISVHRKCKEEEEKKKLPPKKRESALDDEYLDIEMRSLELAAGQLYPTKDDLETRLKTISVLQRFDFDVVASSKMLLVVKCWVPNCGWRVRATRHDDSPSFYIRKYCGEHTCSVTERSSRARQATPDILGRLYLDFVGGVGSSVLPSHVAESLSKRFGLKVQYSLYHAW